MNPILRQVLIFCAWGSELLKIPKSVDQLKPTDFSEDLRYLGAFSDTTERKSKKATWYRILSHVAMFLTVSKDIYLFIYLDKETLVYVGDFCALFGSAMGIMKAVWVTGGIGGLLASIALRRGVSSPHLRRLMPILKPDEGFEALRKLNVDEDDFVRWWQRFRRFMVVNRSAGITVSLGHMCACFFTAWYYGSKVNFYLAIPVDIIMHLGFTISVSHLYTYPIFLGCITDMCLLRIKKVMRDLQMFGKMDKNAQKTLTIARLEKVLLYKFMRNFNQILCDILIFDRIFRITSGAIMGCFNCVNTLILYSVIYGEEILEVKLFLINLMMQNYASMVYMSLKGATLQAKMHLVYNLLHQRSQRTSSLKTKFLLKNVIFHTGGEYLTTFTYANCYAATGLLFVKMLLEMGNNFLLIILLKQSSL